MHTNVIILASSLFVLIIVGMFGYAYLARQAEVPPTSDDLPSEPSVTTDSYAGITRIDAKHFYTDGTHTVVGTLLLPTPCDVPAVSAVVAESLPEQVAIDITVVRTGDMCAQVITEQRFQVTFSASEAAVITAQFMGRDIPLNLIPAAPGETPDSIEFFEKG
jgi:hypothetical protein